MSKPHLVYSREVPLDIGHEFEPIDPMSEAADRREGIGLVTAVGIFGAALLVSLLVVYGVGVVLRWLLGL